MSNFTFNFQKTEIQFYAPAFALLGIYPREMKIYVYIKIYTQMFIIALFIIGKNWKSPKCFPTDEWLNKLLYTHTMEYYTAMNITNS